MRLPHTLALPRRPRRTAVRAAAVRAGTGANAAATARKAVPPQEPATAAATWPEPSFDLAQRVREVGEW